MLVANDRIHHENNSAGFILNIYLSEYYPKETFMADNVMDQFLLALLTSKEAQDTIGLAADRSGKQEKVTG